MTVDRDRIARLIAGPYTDLPPHVKYSLESLQEIVWSSHLTNAERFKYLQAADSILERIIKPLVTALEQIKDGSQLEYDEETKGDVSVWMSADELQLIAYEALEKYNKP